jgi:hypothetical protein
LMRESLRADMRPPEPIATGHSGGTGSEPPAVPGR